MGRFSQMFKENQENEMVPTRQGAANAANDTGRTVTKEMRVTERA